MVKYLKEDKHGNIRTIDIWDKYEFYCMNDCIATNIMDNPPNDGIDWIDLCKTMYCSKCFIKKFIEYIEKPIVKEDK